MEKTKLNSGQTIKAHEQSQCKEEHCCIHNPSKHHMHDWPLHFRADSGAMERICEHGIGHPDPDHIAYNTKGLSVADKEAASIHGCDGCCNEGPKETAGMLFNTDETYTALGSQLGEEALKLAHEIFDRYPNSPLRDIVKIVHDTMDMESVFLRVDRNYKAKKEKGNNPHGL